MTTLVDTSAQPSERTPDDLSVTQIPRQRVNWGHVVGFVTLAYVVAWGLWIAVVPHLDRYLTATRTPMKFAAPGSIVVGMFAPALAAVIMRRFVTKEPLRTSLGPIRRRGKYFAIALVAPALTIALLVNVAVGFHIAHFHAKANIVALVIGLALNALTLNAILAFGEEYGWRGYLLPKLLPLGEARAAVIVGIIWGLWHAPLLITGLNYPGVNPWIAVAMFVPTAVLMSMLFTRLYVAAGGSVIVVTLLHGSLNAFGDGLGDTKRFITDHTLLTSPGGAIAIGLFALIAAAAYGMRAHHRSTRTQ
jgi:membrane protease YdiL (CAAX protease family)